MKKKNTHDSHLKFTIDPEKILTVTGQGKIPEMAFINNTEIKKAVIKKGITEIGDCAFAHCTQLEEISLPHRLTAIGFQAFRSCSALSKVFIPSSVKEIGTRAFWGCTNLRDVTMFQTAEMLGEDIFLDCSPELNKNPDGSDKTYPLNTLMSEECDDPPQEDPSLFTDEEEIDFLPRKEKKKACTNALLIYDALPEEERKLIPEWLILSLQRFYDPYAVTESDPEKISKNLKGLSLVLVEIFCNFNHLTTKKEIMSHVTRRNRAFLIELLSFRLRNDYR